MSRKDASIAIRGGLSAPYTLTPTIYQVSLTPVLHRLDAANSTQVTPSPVKEVSLLPPELKESRQISQPKIPNSNTPSSSRRGSKDDQPRKKHKTQIEAQLSELVTTIEKKWYLEKQMTSGSGTNAEKDCKGTSRGREYECRNGRGEENQDRLQARVRQEAAQAD